MSRLVLGVFALWVGVNAAPSDPTAHVLNGTYAGVRNAHYQQDFFLGMPYAQQPVGDLRFTVPKSLNESWEGVRDAKEYSDICVGYGVSQRVYVSQLCMRRLTSDPSRRTKSGTALQRRVLPSTSSVVLLPARTRTFLSAFGSTEGASIRARVRTIGITCLLSSPTHTRSVSTMSLFGK